MNEGEEKVKSALELALGKAQKLGGMSSDERQKLKDEKLESVGMALSRRYLKGLPIRDLEMELVKHKEDRKKIVSYLLSYLAAEIDMSDPNGTESIIEAFKHFAGATTADFINSLLDEYRSAKEQAWQESQRTLGATKLKELKQKGISGSALKPVIESNPEWLQTQRELNSDYRKRLEGITSSFQAL